MSCVSSGATTLAMSIDAAPSAAFCAGSRMDENSVSISCKAFNQRVQCATADGNTLGGVEGDRMATVGGLNPATRLRPIRKPAKYTYILDNV